MSLDLTSYILIRSRKYCCKLFLLYSAMMFFCLLAMRLLMSDRKLQEGGYLRDGNLLMRVWINDIIPAGAKRIICSVYSPSICFTQYLSAQCTQYMAFSCPQIILQRFDSLICGSLLDCSQWCFSNGGRLSSNRSTVQYELRMFGFGSTCRSCGIALIGSSSSSFGILLLSRTFLREPCTFLPSFEGQRLNFYWPQLARYLPHFPM